jgi:hypothetical protein
VLSAAAETAESLLRVDQIITSQQVIDVPLHVWPHLIVDAHHSRSDQREQQHLPLYKEEEYVIRQQQQQQQETRRLIMPQQEQERIKERQTELIKKVMNERQMFACVFFIIVCQQRTQDAKSFPSCRTKSAFVI